MAIRNQMKTFMLLAVLTALLLWIGNLLGGYSGLIIGLVFALLMNFCSYFFSDRLVLWMYKAKEARKSEYPAYHAIVEDLCKKAGLPKPKLYILPLTLSNAFATGRNPKHASVAVTQGILHLLNREELKGVIAHELSHVKNRDILIMTIAATIAGVISYIASMARWAAIFGGFGGDSKKGSNIIGFLVMAIIAPILALMIQLAISRSREFLADESGAALLQDGKPLASALMKLENEAKAKPVRGDGYSATSSLFIVNPFRAGNFVKMFSTHPPIEERVQKLKGMRFQ